jgi:type I restriction enzyme M protein
LTYLLFLKMAKETGTEDQIPKGHRWDDLEAKPAPERLEANKLTLIYLGNHGSRLVQEIFANASSFIKKPVTLSTLVGEIDKLDYTARGRRGSGISTKGCGEERQREGIRRRPVLHAPAAHR